MKAKRCKTCKKADALRFKDVCGCCEIIATGETPGGHATSNWPWKSKNAAGVHTSQAEEFTAMYRKHGLTSYHEPDGTLVCSDRDQRKRTLAFRNMKDQDAGYSD